MLRFFYPASIPVSQDGNTTGFPLTNENNSKSEPRNVRVGFIGAGGMAQVTHIPNIADVPNTKLVAICDEDLGRANSVAERFNLEASYDDPEEMFKQHDLDCVIITTPTITHVPLGQLACESGVDVFVEKPFARNSHEAQKIVLSAEKHNRILMVGMNHQFREDTVFLRKMLAKEFLGEIFAVSSGWMKRLGVWGRPYWFTDQIMAGGGVLMDLGLQMIDMVMFMLDYPAVIEAVCGTSNDLLDLEVEDSASVFIRFEDDTTFLLEVSWANCTSKDVAYTSFSGSLGRASLNPLRVNRREKNRVVAENPPPLRDEIELYRNSYQREISHFINCVRDRKQPVSDGISAVKVMNIIDRLYQSAGR